MYRAELTRFYPNVTRPKFGTQRQRASGMGVYITSAQQHPALRLSHDNIHHQWSYNRPASKPPTGDTWCDASPHTKLLTYIHQQLPVTVCCQVLIKLYLPIFTTILWFINHSLHHFQNIYSNGSTFIPSIIENVSKTESVQWRIRAKYFPSYQLQQLASDLVTAIPMQVLTGTLPLSGSLTLKMLTLNKTMPRGFINGNNFI